MLSGATVLDVSVGPFLSTANSRQLEPRDINASARVERNRVIIDVCFNRTDPHFGSPGAYTGVVTITDSRVTLTDITFTVTMSYPWWQFVVAVLIAMLLPALLYVWFLRGSFTGHPGLTFAHLQAWIFSRVTLMSLGAGVAAAPRGLLRHLCTGGGVGIGLHRGDRALWRYILRLRCCSDRCRRGRFGLQHRTPCLGRERGGRESADDGSALDRWSVQLLTAVRWVR